MELKTISKICLLFFLYILVAYFYIGLTNIPREGDSLNYHIPIAKSYLNGDIFFPEKIKGAVFLKHSPGASEGILSILYLFGIPPNLYNVFGVIFLFFSLLFLGKNFKLSRELNVIFATSIVTLNGIVRWLDTQIIDIYLAAFFVLSLALLKNPEKKISYFIKLGLVLGMLIGSKYTGMLFASVLFIIFIKNLLPFLSFRNIVAFATPFFLVGLSWYLRNYLRTGNPTYPQGFLFFKDAGFDILKFQVIKVVTGSWYGLIGTLNAFISEYMVWVLAVPISLYSGVKKLLKRTSDDKGIYSLLLVGILNLVIYAFLPSDNKDYIMVSVIRYSYSAMIPFILALFLVAKKLKKEKVLGVVTISSMMWVGFPTLYNPKLVFVFIPIALFIFLKTNTVSDTSHK